ncbi:hypothetical protein NDU88_003573 [Pleurodeles waltl]|uniref:Uncharacterized protein n=1 Tax=Pleurodeles waltl TaxID=8319 RepID=A0AAV7MQY6_PLEWA|nr:hypothetical protein NDU88_003573 [Pleurodeles waltl]
MEWKGVQFFPEAEDAHGTEERTPAKRGCGAGKPNNPGGKLERESARRRDGLSGPATLCEERSPVSRGRGADVIRALLARPCGEVRQTGGRSGAACGRGTGGNARTRSSDGAEVSDPSARRPWVPAATAVASAQSGTGRRRAAAAGPGWMRPGHSWAWEALGARTTRDADLESEPCLETHSPARTLGRGEAKRLGENRGPDPREAPRPCLGVSRDSAPCTGPPVTAGTAARGEPDLDFADPGACT